VKVPELPAQVDTAMSRGAWPLGMDTVGKDVPRGRPPLAEATSGGKREKGDGIMVKKWSLLVGVALVATLVPLSVASASSYLGAMQTGGDRLVATQNADGGWAWPLTGAAPSPPNTVAPIAMGLAQAYRATGTAGQLTALTAAGSFLLAKTNNFSPSDGYLAAELDSIFGVTTYTAHVKANYYDKLAAGTYNRNGLGTLYDTAGYVNLIRTARAAQGIANMAAWDIGIGLVAAASAGAGTSAWVAGVKGEIDELSGSGSYDVLGLAGAVYGLARVGENFDPTAGQHASASSLGDLANILASYQIAGGGFTWNMNYLSAGNETNQETAYAILALNQFNRAAYLDEITGAGAYLISAQLGTGGWNNYVGDPEGENNEITGEALWGIRTSVPEPLTMLGVFLGVSGLAGYMRRRRLARA
jgi:hypothetical protein